jgi:hypothetical protein
MAGVPERFFFNNYYCLTHERETMARKKQVFSKVKAVKDASRATIGAPKATRAIPDAKRKAESRGGKHKKPAGELIQEE